MSDQVVFTKEEVEKIKAALVFARDLATGKYKWNPDTEVLKIEAIMSIFYSPRPRPKISINTLRAIGCGWHTPNPAPIDLISVAIGCGFDVED